MLYHLDFQVEYSDTMSQQDLFTIWSEEADTALGAKAAITIALLFVSILSGCSDLNRNYV